MKIGIIGLGKIGSAVAQRLLQAGYHVVGYDQNSTSYSSLISYNTFEVTADVSLVSQQARIIFIFVPAGAIVDTIISDLSTNARPGDIFIDGGNTFFKDSVARAEKLQKSGIHFLDCGTSGGIHGQKNGFCLMIGGNLEAYEQLKPLFAVIAAPNGYAHVGPSGAGHYVKMVHNGIEYALLQSYAEGFALLHKQKTYSEIDLAQVACLWNNGSVIRSWLLQLLLNGFDQYGQELTTISGAVAEGGTGLWTLQEANAQGVAMPALTTALEVRAASRKTGGDYATTLIAVLRNQFGGHPFEKKEKE